eukprot:gb/GEZN01002790.1/.p2 GENE.gb/GEZN01002790.1/~~gb/GEZN01002790.1/.p2  ORF type:complete len:362 (-),score=61.42 gb/GEZN01002790.1/:1149-2234(-)
MLSSPAAVVTRSRNVVIEENPLVMQLTEDDFKDCRSQDGYICVTDAIAAFQQCNKQAATDQYTYIKRSMGAIVASTKLSFARSNKRSGNKVDCVKFTDLLKILSQLRGERAKQLRQELANLAARSSAGDRDLEEALPQRREAISAELQRGLLHGRERSEDAIDQEIVQVRKKVKLCEERSILRKMEMEERQKMDLQLIQDEEELRQAKMVSFQCQLRRHTEYLTKLKEFGIKLDGRDYVQTNDYVRNMYAAVVDKPIDAVNPIARAPDPELSFTDVAKKMAPGVKGKELESLLLSAGKLMARQYIEKHGRVPAKVPRLVNNAMRQVNLYHESDREIMEAAITESVGKPRLNPNGDITRYFA